MRSAGNYVELVPSLGKTATGEQRGKTWIWFLTRDTMQSMKTAGKRVTLLIGVNLSALIGSSGCKTFTKKYLSKLISLSSATVTNQTMNCTYRQRLYHFWPYRVQRFCNFFKFPHRTLIHNLSVF